MNRMFKKKILLLSITILSILSILGAGFSFWTFNKDARKDLMFDVYVTESALGGTFATPGIPIYAILDEGMQNSNTTITGISFYKSGKKTVNGITFNESKLIDPDLTISFVTTKALSEEEVENFQFGLRVSTTGKLSNYLRKTNYYSQMKVQSNVPNDGKGDYIDLKALAKITNYDGTDNFSCVKNADGRWTLTFQFTTIMLDSFYTYQDGKCPDTKEKLDALRIDLMSQTDLKSSFLLELWQGW